MTRSLIDIYSDELRFLVELKRSVTILNNRIHDKLALIAIEKLKILHPLVNFTYDGAGVGGIDIVGRDRAGITVVIAEVKTTETSDTVGLRGPQKLAIERDLKRLSDDPGDLFRYFIVISEQTKNAVERQIDPKQRFPLVRIIDAIGWVPAPKIL